MPRISKIALAVIAAAGLASHTPTHAAAFTPGNLVVYRVSDGTAPLVSTGNAVFLDEYSVALDGTTILVQSIPLPTAAAMGDSQRQCLTSGTATSEGLLSRSPNGAFLTFTCYARNLTPTGVGSLNSQTAAIVPRVVARVGVDGIVDTSTALTDYASANNPRSAVTDGTGIWAVGGTGGVRYTTLGQTVSTEVSTTITNLRQIDVVGGNLLVSHASGVALGRLSQVGTGLPSNSGQVMTSVPGFPTTAGASLYGFLFVDLDASIGGVDTAYVADDGADNIQKWSLVNGTWTLTGSVNVILAPAGPLVNPRGLTGRIVPGLGVAIVTVADGNAIVIGLDFAGYNVAPDIELQTAVAPVVNRAFRGVAPAPIATVEPPFEFKNGFEAQAAASENRILW